MYTLEIFSIIITYFITLLAWTVNFTLVRDHVVRNNNNNNKTLYYYLQNIFMADIKERQ